MKKDIEMTTKKSTGVADTESMLRNAEQQIQELMRKLKEKEYTIQHMCKKADFYEQIVNNLTTFK